MSVSKSLKELQLIPGVGKSIARDLVNIRIMSIRDLENQDPEELYKKMNHFYGVQQDVCLLYVMRCAVYFASNKKHQKEKLKWWNWKEAK